MAFINYDDDNASIVKDSTTNTLEMEKGTNATFTSADATNAGLITSTDWQRLQNMSLEDLADLDVGASGSEVKKYNIASDGVGGYSLEQDRATIAVEDNKFINGTGEFLTNENWAQTGFTNFTYSQDDADLAFGHVAYQHAGGRAEVKSEYEIFINPYAIFRLEASFKHRRTGTTGDPVLTGDPDNNDPGSFFGITQFDNVGNEIAPTDTMFTGGSLSTLLSPYTPGDAVIEVDNIDGWDFSLTSIHDHAIIAWDYTDPFGKLWMPHTYARQRYIRELWDTNAVPTPITGGFSIPVSTTPYTDFFVGAQTLPAGTQISQGDSGGTFKYTVATNQQFVPNDIAWVRRWGYIGGIDLSGRNDQRSFAQGTASIRILMLPLWTNAYQSDELLVSNIQIHVDPSINKVYTDVVNAGPKTTKTSLNYKPIATNGSVTSQSMTSGIIENS